jgi:hypothetical protein
MTIELTIDTSGLVNKTTMEREEFIDPNEEIVVHLENLLNGLQEFEALLAGLGLVDSVAAVELDTTSKVFLPPRQTSVQREAITSVPQGGLVHDTDIDSIAFFDGLSWQNMGGSGRASALAYNTSNISIASGVPTILLFNAEQFDTDNMHVTEGATRGRLTFNTAGKYNVSASIAQTGSTSGASLLELLVNGAIVIASSRISNAGSVPYTTVKTTYAFAQGDYVEARYTQTSGVSRNLVAASTHLAACLQLSASAIAFSDDFGTPAAGPLSSPHSGSGSGSLILTQTDGQFSIT